LIERRRRADSYAMRVRWADGRSSHRPAPRTRTVPVLSSAPRST
jgi:hypothetical protein